MEKENVYDLDDLFREYDSSFEETDDDSSEYGASPPDLSCDSIILI